MRTILIPLDGSELATRILPYARVLAAALSARIRLIYVVSEHEQRHMMRQYVPEMTLFWHAGDVPGHVTPHYDDALQHLRQEAENYLYGIVLPLRDEGFDVEVDVHFGVPAECIVEDAEKRQGTLIAMVTHGRSGLRRWALGSVTEKVVHGTHAPVFVVRGDSALSPDELPQLKRVLLPLDGSDFARQAVPLAQELATHAHAHIHLVHALMPLDEYPALVRSSVSVELFRDAVADRRRTAARELQTLAHELRQTGLAVNTRVVDGLPAEVILGEAEEHHSDVIVMATHGYTGLRRWTLGSVAHKVLHAARTPLLLVRAREET